MRRVQLSNVGISHNGNIANLWSCHHYESIRAKILTPGNIISISTLNNPECISVTIIGNGWTFKNNMSRIVFSNTSIQKRFFFRGPFSI